MGEEGMENERRDTCFLFPSIFGRNINTLVSSRPLLTPPPRESVGWFSGRAARRSLSRNEKVGSRSNDR
ncbi:unnamed protein product [Victoria cruziana]